MIINKILDEFKRLIAIDSPVGLYEPIEKYIIDRLTAMNVAYYKMNKGGVIAEINVDTSHLKKDPIYVMGHCDTLGLQIRYINEDGTLSVVPLGYLPEHCIIGENVRIYTIDDEIFTGTVQLKYSSEHLRPMDLREKYPHYDDDIIVVIDEDCKCSNDVAKLGINVGDWIAIEPRPIITENGYIRVRVGDDYKYYNFKFEEKNNNEILAGKTLYLSKKDGKYGYIDKNNNLVVDYIYDDAKEQNEYGYSAVKLNNLWGVIDKMGKLIVEPTYELKDNLVIDFIGKYYLGQDLNMNYYTDK